MDKQLDGERQIQDSSIPKTKLNLVDPVFPNDPVTLGYLDDLDILNGLDEVNQRVTEGMALIDELGAKAYPDLQTSWTNANSFVSTTTGAGATVSSANKTISIASGSTGAGATLKQTINLNTFSTYAIGDNVTLRLLLVESVINGINPNVVEIILEEDGVKVENLYYTTQRFTNNDQILEVKIPYTITSLNKILAVTTKIKTSAPVQPSNLLITWNFFGIANQKDKVHDILDAVSQSLKNVRELYAFSTRRPVISKVNTTNTSDNSDRLQDEIDEATQTSGELILPRNATILLKDTVFVNGGVRIIGGGNTNINGEWTTVNKEIFNISTNDSVEFDNFSFVRTNGTWQPTAIKFNSANLNVDSVFRRILFQNLPDSLFIDYTDGLLVDNCRFSAGQNGIRMGHIGANSNKNTTLRNNKFINNFVSGVNAASANGLDIIDSDFYTVSDSTTFCARPIIVTDAVGASRNVNIVNNDILGFREYGVRIGASGTGTIKNVEVVDNTFEDSSASTISVPVAVTAATAYSVNGVKIQANIARTKAICFYAQGIQHIDVSGNLIMKDLSGTYPLAQGLYIDNCPVRRLDNMYSTGLAADQII